MWVALDYKTKRLCCSKTGVGNFVFGNSRLSTSSQGSNNSKDRTCTERNEERGKDMKSQAWESGRDASHLRLSGKISRRATWRID